jgi:glycosyltransferase involved in cell wall biosynthesis
MSSVSVIIPTYNGGEYILDAVNSVLQQTYAPMEIIVVDDGSQEDILRILSPVSDRIRYIRQDNAGPGAARNRGIRAARGEFIAFLDDDDLWHPTKIEAQVRRMSQDPDCGLVYSSAIFMDGNKPFKRAISPYCPSGYIYYDFVRYNLIDTTSAVLVRTSVFEKVGLFEESIGVCEDYDLWLRIAKDYKVLFCSDACLYYRQSPSGISKHNYKHLLGHLYVMNKVIEQFIDGEVHIDKSFINAIGDNLYDIYRRFIYKIYYENDDRITARHLMIAALRKGPWDLKDILFLILFSLPEAWFKYARNMKRALSRSKETSIVHLGDPEIAEKTRS